MTTDFICGADISTLPDTEADGGRFFDAAGKARPLLEILRENGVNGVRLRVWLDPYTADGTPYGGGTCDTEKMLELAQRAKESGMGLLLDFHYSDFWCDPGRQGTPKAWHHMTVSRMGQALYNYTAKTLERFEKAGVAPESVQVGNEITNGMCWETARLDRSTPEAFADSFDALAALLTAGCRAVRAASDAKSVLHLENSGNNALWRQWFDQAQGHALDYDIIGASYYPHWHGSLPQLRANLTDMAERYQKEIQIVETAYPFTAEPFDTSGTGIMIMQDTALPDGSQTAFPYTVKGQADFTRALLETAQQIPRCNAVYWWEPGWLPTPSSTWATRAALAEIGEAEKETGNEWANQCLFDYSGRMTPALTEFRRFAQALNK